jgi:hypothetical protein
MYISSASLSKVINTREAFEIRYSIQLHMIGSPVSLPVGPEPTTQATSSFKYTPIGPVEGRLILESLI